MNAVFVWTINDVVVVAVIVFLLLVWAWLTVDEWWRNRNKGPEV